MVFYIAYKELTLLIFGLDERYFYLIIEVYMPKIVNTA